jgi:catechol 2,3-dioxygenase-like lactoylglutathione lyase family enzyme
MTTPRRWPALAVAILLAASAAAHAQRPRQTARAGAVTDSAVVTGVPVVGMTVSDMARSIDFYSRVLTFRVVADTEVAGEAIERLTGVFGTRARVVRMRLADEEVELTQYLAPRGRPMPGDSRSNDRWFQHVAIIVRDMPQAYARLRQFQVEHASSGPQRLPDWNPNAGGIEAFYFKDPDAHVLEVLAFPRDKGDPRWRRNAGDTLFLGIDHTAIVTANTEASLAFYRDALGLSVAGESENFGPEQERLNNVFGARLRITALRAAHGPGVELLEYLAPRDGRPYPLDARANDLLHWETSVTVRNAAVAAARLRLTASRQETTSVVAFPNPFLGIARAFTTRDPDGHVVRVIEPSDALLRLTTTGKP